MDAPKKDQIAAFRSLQTSFNAFRELHGLSESDSDLQHSIAVGEQLIRVAAALGNPREEAETCLELGLLLSEKKAQPQLCEDLLCRAKAVFRGEYDRCNPPPAPAREKLSKTLSELLELLRRAGRFEEALEVVCDLIKIQSLARQIEDQAVSYADKGNVLDELKRPHWEIEEAYKQSLSLAVCAKSVELQLSALENLDLCSREVMPHLARSYRERFLALKRASRTQDGSAPEHEEEADDEDAEADITSRPITVGSDKKSDIGASSSKVSSAPIGPPPADRFDCVVFSLNMHFCTVCMNSIRVFFFVFVSAEIAHR